METNQQYKHVTWVRCLKELAVPKSFLLPSPLHSGWPMLWSSILGKIQKPLLAWKNAWKEAFESTKGSLLTYLTNFPRDTGYERIFYPQFQQFPGCVVLSLKLLESSSNYLSFTSHSSHIQALSRLRFQISLTGTALGKSLKEFL